MKSSTREALQRAYELLKIGQRTEALQIVQQIILTDDANIDAWWLMANTVENPADRRVALAHVLDLNPNHGKARKMLDDLIDRYPELARKPDLLTSALPSQAAPDRPGRRLLLAGAVVLILLAILVAWLISSGILTLPGALSLLNGFMR